MKESPTDHDSWCIAIKTLKYSFVIDYAIHKSQGMKPASQ